MKIRFLVSNLIFSFLVYTNLNSTNFFAKTIPPVLTQINCTIEQVSISPGNKERSSPHIPPKKRSKGDKEVKSLNWSGYVAENNLRTPSNFSVFGVSGSWTVPKISPSRKNKYSVIWVGMDGFNNFTVEQIGTAHNWVNGKLQTYAWFDMFPAGSFIIRGFPIRTGDTISASVVYSGNSIFTMQISNLTQQTVFNVPTSFTQSSTALRSSAEWIVEAPSSISGKILPLANFGDVHFSNCFANIGGYVAPIDVYPHSPIVMVTENGKHKSVPSHLYRSEGAFKVKWKHS